MDVMTITEFSREVKRHYNWTRSAIKTGKLPATKVGGRWLIKGSEARKFNKRPFKVSRKDL